MDLDSLRHELGIAAQWSVRGDAHWLDAPELDVTAMATTMIAGGGRFVTLTVTPSGDGFRLLYHWDLTGQLVNIATVVPDAHAVSIAAICPAADWVEREACDYFGLEFEGRADTPPLMLRGGDPRGLFTRTRAMGRNEDPADAAHRPSTGRTDAPEVAP